MSVLDAFNSEMANMSCSINLDPLQSYLYEINAQLEINGQLGSSSRDTCHIIMPSIPDICIHPVFPVSRMFTLQVDLKLFQNLFWYKNYSDGFVKYAKLNSICLSLLKSVHFLNAIQLNPTSGPSQTYTGSSGTIQYQTLIQSYLTYLDSLYTGDLSEIEAYITQKIKVSLYLRFTKIMESLQQESLSSVVTTLLNQINPPQSSASYSPVPFIEGDSLMFYGAITSDIPNVDPFEYGIELILTNTISYPPDYTEVDSTYESTDTFICLQMSNRVINNVPLADIVHAYIPVNLDYLTYKNALLALYENLPLFTASITQADSYHALYGSTSNYMYEMYAIGILTQIALYYRD